MRELFELSDARLTRAIDALEKYGSIESPRAKAFLSARGQLSQLAWSAYADALGCDNGPIAEKGVIWRPLSEDWAARFAALLDEAPPTTLRRDDFALGYMATLDAPVLDYLNGTNEYREVTRAFCDALAGFIDSIAPEIEQQFRHSWRVASIRQFHLKSGASGGRHTDNWPVAMRKLFVLPKGATLATGTTWFRLRNGEELILDSNRPIWAIFENSAVDHALVSSTEASRPTIELDLVPSLASSRKPFYAGINGWYPWFPTEKGLLEGTRIALSVAMNVEDTPAPVAEPASPPLEEPPPAPPSLPRRLVRRLRRVFQ